MPFVLCLSCFCWTAYHDVFCRWSKFFKSRLVAVITTYGNTAFIVIICILVFLLVGEIIVPLSLTVCWSAIARAIKINTDMFGESIHSEAQFYWETLAYAVKQYLFILFNYLLMLNVEISQIKQNHIWVS